MVRREEAGSRTCPSPQISALGTHEAQHPQSRCWGKETRLEDRSGPSHIKTSFMPAQGRPCQKGWGATGRGQELPAPAWAGRHTGGMFLPLPGPPSACHRAHPGLAECKAWGLGGAALSAGSRRPPTSMPARPRFPSVYKGILGRV